MSFALAAETRGFLSRASDRFERWFPTPRLLLPYSVGIDISDSSVKWLAFSELPLRGYRISSWGSIDVPPGVVDGGIINDMNALTLILKEIKKRVPGATHAHAALPEEPAYVFSMNVPRGTGREQIIRLIEFEFEGRVPIPPSSAVYDYDIIEENEREGTEISVSVFPIDAARAYGHVFENAGIELLSLEIEARSIARAITVDTDPITLVVDFGLARTGFAVVKHSIPIFTSTVEIGGAKLTEVVMEGLACDEAAAQVLKNEQGLLMQGENKKKIVDDMRAVALLLGDEVARHFHYWDTRRDDHGERMTPVEKILLIGGSANLKGLADVIAMKVQAPTSRGNIWGNICSFDDYIPAIDRRASLQYATAAGLALRGL